MRQFRLNAQAIDLAQYWSILWTCALWLIPGGMEPGRFVAVGYSARTGGAATENTKQRMQVEASNLTTPISADSPCGVDLDESEPLLLAAFDAYRIFGLLSPWPKDAQPDWREIRDRSLEALAKSRDLRILSHLAVAMLRIEGIEGFSRSLSIAAQWLGEWWEPLYPRVDEDAILRRNALNALADRVAVLDGLRRAPLLEHRQLGACCIRDIEIAHGQFSPAADETARDPAEIDALLAAMELEPLQSLAGALHQALDSYRAIETLTRDRAGSEAVPDFTAALALLGRTLTLIETQLRARAPDPAGEPVQDGAVVAHTAGVPHAIGTRAEAIKALDAVAAYFRTNEPSSPIPMFLERAKRLIGKDFLAVLEDVVPESVAQAKSIGGIRDDE